MYGRKALIHRSVSGENMAMDQATMEAAMGNAMSKGQRYISYPDYKTSEDFSLWLSGFWTRIQSAYGLQPGEQAKIKAEIVRSISSRLSVGGALDAYNRLTDAEKSDYKSLTKRLTEEFTDDHEKRKFIENMGYDKRKKAQKLKDFMQQIKKNMDRYSGVPSKITEGIGAAAAEVSNPEREKQGVRRFRTGIRNINGKKDKDLNRHLLFYLMQDEDLTWKNAITLASRWEMANPDESDSKSASDASDEEEEEAGAVATKRKKTKKIKSKDEERITIAALADQVHENQMKIKGMETAQERLTAVVGEVKNASETSLSVIQALSNKFDSLALPSQQPNNGSRFFPAHRQQLQQHQQQQQQQPIRPTWAQQNSNSFGAAQKVGNAGAFRGRPQNYTWVGRNNQQSQPTQQRQMRFSYQRRTPETYTTNATQTRPTTTIAAMEENAADDETSGLEEEEPKISLNMSEFMDLTTLAGFDVGEGDLLASIDDMNFA